MRRLAVIIRHIRHASKQAVLFVLCVALSLITLTAISGLSRRVDTALLQDARSLHAADIIIRSYDPISESLVRAIDRLVAQDRILRAGIHEFYSVVRAADEDASVLSRLKVVEAGYPFYGQITLKSNRSFRQVLSPGTCIVEQSLLDRIGADVGDILKVGYTTLVIADVVTLEPDRSLALLAFGPRVFIHNADLASLGLMATGSRIRRSVLLKVQDPLEVDGIAAQLKSASPHDTARIDTYLTAGSAVKRYIDSFIFFLRLEGLFILIISGLGMQSTLMALFKEKQYTIAVMKAVGATNYFISMHFIRLTLFLGAVGTGVGILVGAVVQAILAGIIAPLLPNGFRFSIAWSGVIEAVLLGLAVVAIFAFQPLCRLREMRPVMIFKRQPPRGNHLWPDVVSGSAALLLLLALVIWHMRDIRFGVYFAGGVAAVVATAVLLAHLTLWAIRRLTARRLTLRQAIKGLFRRGNTTRTTVVTMTVALTVIFAITLIERNLNATFVQSFPENSPNTFFIDIQPNQTAALSSLIGQPVVFHPIIRARVTAVNGAAIDGAREYRQRRDNLSRVFNLTYQDRLTQDERLIEGETLFRSDWNEIQVSVMDTVLEMQPMAIGDRIQFKIQGVPLSARIASIRTRMDKSFKPFFYFVFPTSVLEKAPQTLFAARTVAPGQIGALQNRIVSQFPNISVIDLSQTISIFIRLMSRLSKIIQLFSLLGVTAGILILVSAVFATRAERVVEAVYYKILGAGRRFVLTVLTLENLLIGLLSTTFALLMAHGAAWWICTLEFDIGYRSFFPISMAMAAFFISLVIAVGLAASQSVMAKKPSTYLREQQDG